MALAPWARTSVSGSSPSGSVATLTRRLWRKSSSPARKVARSPASSESYNRITCAVCRLSKSAWSLVSPVPSGATTSSTPASTSRTTSK